MGSMEHHFSSRTGTMDPSWDLLHETKSETGIARLLISKLPGLVNIQKAIENHH